VGFSADVWFDSHDGFQWTVQGGAGFSLMQGIAQAGIAFGGNNSEGLSVEGDWTYDRNNVQFSVGGGFDDHHYWITIGLTIH
jgi:hypothetical protein